MHVWNVLHATRWKYRVQKWCKKSPSVHHRTTLSGYIFQIRHVSIIGKKLFKQQYLLLMSSQYGELCGTPSNFNRFRILASLLQRRRSPEANQSLHDLWRFPGLVHYIYIFGGSCPLTEFCLEKNSLYIQVLCLLYWHGTPAPGVSQTLQHGIKNGIAELSQRVPPIFSWVAITLGIGPHSSCECFQINTCSRTVGISVTLNTINNNTSVLLL